MNNHVVVVRKPAKRIQTHTRLPGVPTGARSPFDSRRTTLHLKSV